jgi:2-polyprenyl-3-methyl-5-hydroxy-6-metoxy-1,4-benzoquinol methylase
MDSYKITFQAWDKVAALYQDKFMHLDLYNDTYDAFCKLIKKPNARIFEIGCGPGNITKYLLSKRPDFIVDAIDVAPNMIKLAKKNNPRANFTMMDCRGIDTITKKFDGIMCGFCMPYLTKADCAKLLKDCSFLLNPGGIFYGSVIEGDYQQSGYETSSNGQTTMYVYYHQEDYLRQELKHTDFKLIDLIRKAYTKADGTTNTHMIFIAIKTTE